MLFLCNSRLRPGVSREKAVEHLKRPSSEEDWELIRTGVISHWAFKVGDQPGLIVILNGDNIEETRTLANDSPLVKEGILEFEIDPLDHFLRFDR